MRTIFLFVILYLLAACHRHNISVFTTDKNYYEIKRQFSPNKTRLLLTYGIRQEVTGKSKVGTAVLHLADTLRDIKPFTISFPAYQNCTWLDNDTVIIHLDYLKRMRLAATRMYYDTFSINGIQIMFDLKDNIDSSYRMDTLFNEVSPNNEYRAVAYSYRNSMTMENFLNISVISPTGPLPKYGNYFISDVENDYVYGVAWSKSNELIFYTSSSAKNKIPGYLVQNRRNVSMKIIVDDNRFGGRLRWVKNVGVDDR